jgi:hypothetical protein
MSDDMEGKEEQRARKEMQIIYRWTKRLHGRQQHWVIFILIHRHLSSPGDYNQNL